MSLELVGLFVYPIKSARGVSLSEAPLTPRGLLHDRRFMVVDADGLFLTQRQEPRMARLVPALTESELRVTFDGLSPLALPLTPAGGELRSVRVWRDEVEAVDLGAPAAQFLSAALQREARLVYMPDTTRRQVQRDYAEEGDVVSFADGFPYLLTNEGSLAELNTRLELAVPMDRFRPNLVVQGADAYAEDNWQRLRIGDATFDVKKPCDRCVIINTDQTSGERAGKEPLKTLAGYHTWHVKSAFGQNLLRRSGAFLRVGDHVEVLD